MFSTGEETELLHGHLTISDVGVTQTANALYDGMISATQAATNHFLTPVLSAFAKRQLENIAAEEFSYCWPITKQILPADAGAAATTLVHNVPRFSLEFLCCISALNLYRADKLMPELQRDLLHKCYFSLLCDTEEEWIASHASSLPYFAQETGHKLHHWRRNITLAYLNRLQNKSSLDADITIALRRLFARQGLAKEAGVDVSPALIEECVPHLETYASWLQHYVKYQATEPA